MTPLDAEVAFLLEGVPGVFDLHAVRGRPEIRWVVRYSDTRALAIAQSRLSRVLSHEDLRRTRFLPDGTGGLRRMDLQPVELDEPTRAAARARIAALPEPDHHPDPFPAVQLAYSVLVVHPTLGLEGEVRRAFGEGAEHLRVPDAASAMTAIHERPRDIVLCAARLAYGEEGLIPLLLREDADRAARVAVIVDEKDEHFANHQRALLKLPNYHPHAPIDDDVLWLLATTPPSPSRPPRQKPRRVTRAPSPRRVLLIDEYAKPVEGDFTMVVVREPWDALDRIEEDWHLVICSIRMTLGKQKLYSALWKANPGIKRRIVLLLGSASSDPAQPRTIGRLLTPLAIESLLDRVDFMPPE